MISNKFVLPGINDPAFIIAELSANHNNNLELAVKTIEAIAKSGANAVKVQTYTADSLSLTVNNKYFGSRTEGLWKGRKPYELFKEAALPYEWHPKLKKVAEENGLIFFSSPFDLDAVDFLEKLDISLYKVASPEITDTPLIEYIAKKKKPVIFSTGLAELIDIKNAIKCCKESGNNDYALLKCTSQYPAQISNANLNTIPDLQKKFSCTIGVSDHSMGFIIPVVSVALGAKIIEKHFVLNRSNGGVDASFSMEPLEFSEMVKYIREAEISKGTINYDVSEKDKLRRRSLFVVKNMEKGDVFSPENIRSIRPGYGLCPSFLKKIIGGKAKKTIKKGTPLNWDLIL